MKFAVISDIHGNLPALDAVLADLEQWDPEHVVVNGDLVNRGPDSAGCTDRLKERLPDALCTRGNHDNLVLECTEGPLDPADPAYEIRRMSRWTAEQMGGGRLDILRAWPGHLTWQGPSWGTVHMTHGSRINDRDGISPKTPDEALTEKVGEGVDLFICSHTHQPMLRRWRDTLVVNTGAVGQPFDGDPRAAYGRFTFVRGEWHAEVRRVAYNQAQALRDFYDRGFIDGAGPLARVVYREIEVGRGLLLGWMRRYAEAVKEGEIDLDRAVNEYLAST